MRKFNFEILEIKKSNNNEILTQTCLGFIDDIIKFYSLDKKGNTYIINKIKRLSDGVIFTVGDNVYIPDTMWVDEIIESFEYDSVNNSGILIYLKNDSVGLHILNKISHNNTNNDMKKGHLLNFIKRKEPNISKVLNFKLNDFDGDHGFSEGLIVIKNHWERSLGRNYSELRKSFFAEEWSLIDILKN